MKIVASANEVAAIRRGGGIATVFVVVDRGDGPRADCAIVRRAREPAEGDRRHAVRRGQKKKRRPVRIPRAS